MPLNETVEQSSSEFQVAKRSLALFCLAILLLTIGSIDVGNASGEEEEGRILSDLSTFQRQFVEQSPSNESSSGPDVVRACGPAQLTGRVEMGGAIANWLPWSQIRTGTVCQHVRFRQAFTNKHDIRLFLSADRTASERNGHLTPVVWAEKVAADGFHACAHFHNDFDEEPEYWKEKLVISWWAVDSESPASFDRRYLGRVVTSLDKNRSVCMQLPVEVNPHSNTVLTSTSHPGVKYEKHYSYQPVSTHTPTESVISWINERTNNKFDVCTKRLYEKTPGKIEDAGVDVVSLRRNKRFTGLAKVRLGDYGRGCVYVDSDLTKVGSADDGASTLPIVLVQARINRNDLGQDGRSPQVATWVEQKLARGFTVCAKNLARGVREAKHTVQIHWIAVHEVPLEMDLSLCRDGIVDL